MTIQPVENNTAPAYPDKYAAETRRILAAAQPARNPSACYVNR